MDSSSIHSTMTREAPRSPHYWFRAKRYGWGWGPPCAWQGWVTLAVWIALVFAIGLPLAGRSLLGFYIFVAAMVVALILVCLWKGEPPR